jgi:hypothetical protein
MVKHNKKANDDNKKNEGSKLFGMEPCCQMIVTSNHSRWNIEIYSHFKKKVNFHRSYF